jgi:GNAT superfamily N-acetyltransferase
MPVADHTQSTQQAYTTRPLTRTTWDAFARLVEANNGVWGGCWCMGFHPEGFSQSHTAGGNRGAKESLVRARQVHQVLVFDDDEAIGWCQYGTPVELPNIKNPAAYEKGLEEEPDWRIGCIFTDKRHRRAGVAHAAVAGALDAIRQSGGGLVEAYPEQVEDRKPQPGAFFHTGPESLFEEFGFERDRRIAKWRWVMRLRVDG